MKLVICILLMASFSTFANCVTGEDREDVCSLDAIKTNRSTIAYDDIYGHALADRQTTHMTSPDNGQMIEMSILTKGELIVFFQEVANNGGIPWDEMRSANYNLAKAHAVGMLLDTSHGVKSAKVFIYGKIAINTESGIVNLDKYAAVVVLVKFHEDPLVPYVIDPSLFGGPVSLREWQAKILRTTNSADIAKQFYANRFTFGDFDREEDKDSTKYSQASVDTTMALINKHTPK